MILSSLIFAVSSLNFPFLLAFIRLLGISNFPTARLSSSNPLSCIKLQKQKYATKALYVDHWHREGAPPNPPKIVLSKINLKFFKTFLRLEGSAAHGALVGALSYLFSLIWTNQINVYGTVE